jgi:hypothetical protein
MALALGESLALFAVAVWVEVCVGVNEAFPARA